MICSTIGRLPTVRHSKGFGCWGRAGRRRVYDLRDFLARNHVPYQWIDVEISANDPETKRLLEALGPDAASLPVVLFPDGTKLLESLPADVANKVGLRTRAQTNFYDLAIVGGGPAGLAAAVYGASEGSANGDDRTGSARRTGGNEFAYRKLSGISGRPQRQRSGAASSGAGAALWSGNTFAGGSGWRPDWRGLTGSSRWRTGTKSPAMP